MSYKFLHGVEVLEVTDGPRPISTVKTSVIGIVGTAPDASAAVAASLTLGSGTAALTFAAKTAGALGNELSVAVVKPSTASQTLAVALSGKAVTITLATDATGAATSTADSIKTALDANTGIAALVSTTSGGTGVVSPTVRKYLSGGAAEPFPLNTPVLVASSRKEAAKLGSTGTLPTALDGIFDQAGAVVIVVRVAEGADEAATVTNVIGGVSVAGESSGIQCLLDAESVVGYAPRILIAPGFAGTKSVVDELLSVADRIRAIVIADGPASTDTAAIAFGGLFGSSRLYLVEPSVTVLRDGVETIEPASSRVAGLIAKSDNARGFWWSPSNQEILGIVAPSRPIDFILGDADARANLLNEQNIATIIRQNGFRLWGNRTLSSDPAWAFLSVRRTADVIADSIQRKMLWAVDRPVSRQLCESIKDSVNSYLRTLTTLGAILGGECWYERDDNPNGDIAQGIVRFRYKFTPPPPAEHIAFYAESVEDYYDAIFANS